MLTIQWLTLRLDIPGSQTLFDQACAFWATATRSTLVGSGPITLEPEHGTSYLSLQSTGTDAGQPASASVDGLCALAIVLAPATALEHARDQALELGALPDDSDALHREFATVQLKSPAGYAFSLMRGSDGDVAVPPAAEIGNGGLSRADQVCLDIPPTEFDAECVFWQALTGWPLTSRADSEFAHLQRPADIPIRILLQRRDDAEPDDIVTGHLDFATEDRKSLAAEHVRAGATLVVEYPDWIILRDPAGRIYCLTARDPA